jgi:hypothetical protein
MSSYIVNLLIEERDRLQEAIFALQGAAPAKRRGRPPAKKIADLYDDPTMPDWVKPKVKVAAAAKRKMSAAGRRAIREGVRKRWAAVKAAKAEAAAPKKRTMSAGGRQRIIDATKARWAKVRAAKAAVTPKAASAKTPAATKKKASTAKSAAFSKKMSETMKKAWAKRKKAAKKAA